MILFSIDFEVRNNFICARNFARTNFKLDEIFQFLPKVVSMLCNRRKCQAYHAEISNLNMSLCKNLDCKSRHTAEALSYQMMLECQSHESTRLLHRIQTLWRGLVTEGCRSVSSMNFSLFLESGESFVDLNHEW